MILIVFLVVFIGLWYFFWKSPWAKKRKERKKEQELLKKAEEATLVLKISLGQIEPISPVINLEVNEKAYAQFNAYRMASVEHTVEHTTGEAKKKGVFKRAIVGGVLLGPLGALGGAATAGSKITSTTVQTKTKKVEKVDEGFIILTNKRVLFSGQNILSLPYNEIIGADFSNYVGDRKVFFKYADMLEGEFFQIPRFTTQHMDLYYKGITEKFLSSS